MSLHTVNLRTYGKRPAETAGALIVNRGSQNLAVQTVRQTKRGESYDSRPTYGRAVFLARDLPASNYQPRAVVSTGVRQ